MDWADDVAYSVHDVEDGIHAGHIDLTALQRPGQSATSCALVATTSTCPGTDPAELAAALDRLVGAPVLACRVLALHRQPARPGRAEGHDQPADRAVHGGGRVGHP